MTRVYAVVVQGQAVAPGTPVPEGIAPHPEPEERSCSATTKAGEPCKGRPGDDGLCAAHKDVDPEQDGEGGET